MHKLSGLLLDFYDDGGATIAAAFDAVDELPGYIKEAHALTTDEQQALPDDVFALVLSQGQDSLRKYACTDAGNTALSVSYFLQYGHKLPKEAQQLAAQNLMTACSWYGLDPHPALEKVAIGLTTAGIALNALAHAPSHVAQAKRNLAVARTTPELAGGVGMVNPMVAKARSQA